MPTAQRVAFRATDSIPTRFPRGGRSALSDMYQRLIADITIDIIRLKHARASAAQGDVLGLVPLQGFDEVLRCHVRP